MIKEIKKVLHLPVLLDSQLLYQIMFFRFFSIHIAGFFLILFADLPTALCIHSSFISYFPLRGVNGGRWGVYTQQTKSIIIKRDESYLLLLLMVPKSEFFVLNFSFSLFYFFFFLHFLFLFRIIFICICINRNTQQGRSGTKLPRLDIYRSIILSAIIRQMWHFHPFSERNRTSKIAGGEGWKQQKEGLDKILKT